MTINYYYLLEVIMAGRGWSPVAGGGGHRRSVPVDRPVMRATRRRVVAGQESEEVVYENKKGFLIKYYN